MNELEITKHAKEYIDKMAKGINPLNDSPIAENDILNNVRLSRCLFYVSDILRQVIENGGTVKKNKIPKQDFSITYEEIHMYKFSENPISLSEIVKRINNLINAQNMKHLTYNNVAEWLVGIEMLRVEILETGKKTKRPTEHGIELGMSTVEIEGRYGMYTGVFYDRKAQQFIIDNIDSVIGMINEKRQKA